MSAGDDIIDKVLFFFRLDFIFLHNFVHEFCFTVYMELLDLICENFREYFILLRMKAVVVLPEVPQELVYMVQYGACALFQKILPKQIRSIILF